KANALASKIGAAITSYNATSLGKCNHRFNSGDMWEKVNQLLHKTKQPTEIQSITATSLNAHFTSISTDSQYTIPFKKDCVSPSVDIFTEYQIFHILDTLTNTATGLDQFLAWFF